MQLVLQRRQPDRLRPRNRAPRAGPVDVPTHSMSTHSAVSPLMPTGSPTTSQTWAAGASMDKETSMGDMGRTLPTAGRGGRTGPSDGVADRYSSRPNLPKILLVVMSAIKGVGPPWWIGEWRRTGSFLADGLAGSTPPEVFATGRVCAAEECTVKLSRYNSTEWCALHESPASTQRPYDTSTRQRRRTRRTTPPQGEGQRAESAPAVDQSRPRPSNSNRRHRPELVPPRAAGPSLGSRRYTAAMPSERGKP